MDFTPVRIIIVILGFGAYALSTQVRGCESRLAVALIPVVAPILLSLSTGMSIVGAILWYLAGTMVAFLGEILLTLFKG